MLTPLEESLFKIIHGLIKANTCLVQLHTEYRNHTDSGIVLAATQIINERVGTAIQTQIDPLKSSDIKKILGAPASPKGLAVKLDVAHALQILDKPTYNLAVQLKDIRNIFGHDRMMLSLHQEPALSAFTVMHTNPDFQGNYKKVFMDYAGVVDKALTAYMESVSPALSSTLVGVLESQARRSAQPDLTPVVSSTWSESPAYGGADG